MFNVPPERKKIVCYPLVNHLNVDFGVHSSSSYSSKSSGLVVSTCKVKVNQLHYKNGLIRNAGFECIKCVNCLLCHLTSAVPKKFSHINMHEQQSVIERMVVFILSGPRCNVSKDVLGAVSAIDEYPHLGGNFSSMQ